MIHGQDWASYQGASPSTAGLDFAFVKVTQGLSYVNPYWQRQAEVAHRAGLVLGLYHYPDMHNGAGAEAQHFVQACGVLAQGAMLCLDWEGYDSTNKSVSHAEQAAYKDAFLEHLAVLAPRERTVLYCNVDYWTHVDGSGKHGDALWIATSGRAAGAPGIATPWLFHQYAVTNGVDQDVAAFPDRAALAAWASKAGGATPPPPTEVDMTPEEAQQLTDVHNALPVLGWGYRNKDEDAAAEAATHSHSLDAWGKLSQTHDLVLQLQEKVAELEAIIHTIPTNGLNGTEVAAAAKAGGEAGAAYALQKLGDILKSAA